MRSLLIISRFSDIIFIVANISVRAQDVKIILNFYELLINVLLIIGKISIVSRY